MTPGHVQRSLAGAAGSRDRRGGRGCRRGGCAVRTRIRRDALLEEQLRVAQAKHRRSLVPEPYLPARSPSKANCRWLVSRSTAPPTGETRTELLEPASATMKEMNREDPGVEPFARKRYGDALFPEVAKGGLVFGGAYGRGVVYEQGQLIGYADLTPASLGLPVGARGTVSGYPHDRSRRERQVRRCYRGDREAARRRDGGSGGRRAAVHVHSEVIRAPPIECAARRRARD